MTGSSLTHQSELLHLVIQCYSTDSQFGCGFLASVIVPPKAVFDDPSFDDIDTGFQGLGLAQGDVVADRRLDFASHRRATEWKGLSGEPGMSDGIPGIADE